MEISIVIPIAPGDFTWQKLLASAPLENSELPIVLSVADECSAHEKALYEKAKSGLISVVSGPQGRAAQLNRGAAFSNHSYLWFLHSDSKLSPSCIDIVMEKVDEKAKGLFFFDLKFDDGSLSKMLINEVGVFLRSRCLKMPFGDQGFLIDKQTFLDLGAFDEEAAYGEDHLLVWSCHLNGIPVKAIGASIQTSARKYHDKGWLQTTGTHLKLTYRQAFPEFVKLIKKRVGASR